MKTIVVISSPSYWEEAQASGAYTHSTLDTTLDEVGFIHCTFPDQTMGVIGRHFADRKELLLLLIDEDKVTAPVKHEGSSSGRAGIYPHIYGLLNTDAVYDTVALRKDKNGIFVAPAHIE